MMERVLSHDDASGLTTWFSASEDGDTWNLRYEQDVSPVLDYNKEQQSESFDKRAEMWHAAKVPTVVMMEWMTKYGVELWNPDHKEGVRRLLNHPDYRYLRVNHFIV